jgi:hypothetical protein
MKFLPLFYCEFVHDNATKGTVTVLRVFKRKDVFCNKFQA